jgi:hypothetical protein
MLNKSLKEIDNNKENEVMDHYINCWVTTPVGAAT